jgi:hypothetical protein
MRADRRNAANTAMRANTFGVEIEFVGIGRGAAGLAIAAAVGGVVSSVHDDEPTVTLPDGRAWKLVRDGSLSASLAGEAVSPICKWEDLEMVAKVARAIRAAGGRADSSCGIHVHVGAALLGPAGVGNVAKLVGAIEPLLRHALDVGTERSRYCRPLPASIVDRLSGWRPTSLDEVAVAWYGERANSFRRTRKYDDSRYHGLNLHSVLYRGTVEFRWFNGTLHAGKIKAYIHLALAMSGKAASARTLSSKVLPVEKREMVKLLSVLGLVGEEFSSTRKHLLAAWEPAGAAGEVAA